jgi:hypothetical protein
MRVRRLTDFPYVLVRPAPLFAAFVKIASVAGAFHHSSVGGSRKRSPIKTAAPRKAFSFG